MSNEKQRNNWLKVLSNPKLLFGISLIFIIIALGAPIIFTKIPAIITFSENSGTIGDTFGMMNPFIAIAAAVITFAAFSVQYEANQEMRIDNKKQQIINRFYEMLRIHRDNVNDIEWCENIQHTQKNSIHNFTKTTSNNDDELKEEQLQKNGREIFQLYLTEFNTIYRIIDIIYPKADLELKTKKAYNMFYRGEDDTIVDFNIKYHISQALLTSRNILQFNDAIQKMLNSTPLEENQKNDFANTLMQLFLKQDFFSLNPPFSGRFGQLNCYYRHLFLTVKSIANENENVLSYKEKRDLLRILRTQLSTIEQTMLFYNWFSGNGCKWEESSPNGNHFFTQFHMVHNIIPGAFIPFHTKDSDTFTNFINYFKDKLPIKEYCTKADPMFEFEEIDGNPTFKYDH